MRSFAKNYGQYLRELPHERRIILESLRNLITQELPDVRIVMKWGMPVFYQNNKEIVAMAAQKQYYSLYIWKFDWKSEFASQIEKLKTGKECIHFTQFEELPQDTIRNLIRRSAEAD